jgi:hypothetical protein
VTPKEDFTLPKVEQFFALKTGTPILSEKASIHAKRNALLLHLGPHVAVSRTPEGSQNLRIRFTLKHPSRRTNCDTLTFLLATDSFITNWTSPERTKEKGQQAFSLAL